ncbi:MAG: hypothetical protein WC822_05255 [Candidatus Paceibacterota bacterium]|jgi:hypothetical protein
MRREISPLDPENLPGDEIGHRMTVPKGENSPEKKKRRLKDIDESTVAESAVEKQWFDVGDKTAQEEVDEIAEELKEMPEISKDKLLPSTDKKDDMFANAEKTRKATEKKGRKKVTAADITEEPAEQDWFASDATADEETGEVLPSTGKKDEVLAYAEATRKAAENIRTKALRHKVKVMKKRRERENLEERVEEISATARQFKEKLPKMPNEKLNDVYIQNQKDIDEFEEKISDLWFVTNSKTGESRRRSTAQLPPEQQEQAKKLGELREQLGYLQLLINQEQLRRREEEKKRFPRANTMTERHPSATVHSIRTAETTAQAHAREAVARASKHTAEMQDQMALQRKMADLDEKISTLETSRKKGLLSWIDRKLFKRDDPELARLKQEREKTAKQLRAA